MGRRQLALWPGSGAPRVNRLHRFRLIGQLVAAGSIAIGAGMVVTSGAGAASSGWQVSKSTTAPVGVLSAVTCPTATACTAVGAQGDFGGAQIVASTDGGATWTEQVPPATTGPLAGVSCASATTCVAVGSDLTFEPGPDRHHRRRRGDLGTRTVPGNAGSLAGVSCPTATFCVAVGSDNDFFAGIVDTSTDGGTTWVQRTVPEQHRRARGGVVLQCHLVRGGGHQSQR